jgi:hypothetical protein
LERIGQFRAGETFSKDVELKIDVPSPTSKLRLVAFVQESSLGKVLGATAEIVGKP